MHKEETNQTTLKKKKEEDFLFQKNNVIIQMEFKLEKKKNIENKQPSPLETSQTKYMHGEVQIFSGSRLHDYIAAIIMDAFMINF